MIKFIVASFILLLFSACTNNRAVAINEYTPQGEIEELSGTTVTITSEMIEDVQARRANFLKEHLAE